MIVGGIAIPLTTKMSIPVFMSQFYVETIAPQSLKALLEENAKSVILIDVRSPTEYQENHIENSVSIPLLDIELGFGVKRIQTLIKENHQDSFIVLYCTSGARSLKAHNLLQKKGVDTIILWGGMNAWEKL